MKMEAACPSETLVRISPQKTQFRIFLAHDDQVLNFSDRFRKNGKLVEKIGFEMGD